MRYGTSVERIGRREGLKEGLRDGLEFAVKLKFGTAADQILPEIRKLTDLDRIRAVYAHLETTTTIDDVRQVLTGGAEVLGLRIDPFSARNCRERHPFGRHVAVRLRFQAIDQPGNLRSFLNAIGDDPHDNWIAP